MALCTQPPGRPAPTPVAPVLPSGPALTVEPVPSTQHHKGKKRPRAWHRGRAAGAKQVKALQAIEKAEQRHAKAEAANVAQKLMHMEEVDMWTGIQHAAPPAGLAWFDHNNERRWWQWLTRRSSTTGRSGRAAS